MHLTISDLSIRRPKLSDGTSSNRTVAHVHHQRVDHLVEPAAPEALTGPPAAAIRDATEGAGAGGRRAGGAGAARAGAARAAPPQDAARAPDLPERSVGRHLPDALHRVPLLRRADGSRPPARHRRLHCSHSARHSRLLR